MQAYLPGKLHFKMEEAGKPSRWNTLRVLRVLKRYGDQLPAAAAWMAEMGSTVELL
jgi:hypothetical protein